MKTACVITSIHDPNLTSVKAWADIFECVYLVLDKKSVAIHSCPKHVKVIPADQTCDWVALPHNHYSRKMYGYLSAYRDGYEAVFETDDDNWPIDSVDYTVHGVPANITVGEWFNSMAYFGYREYVPRGLPYYYAHEHAWRPVPVPVPKVAVTQFWVKGDPDVWALDRMYYNDQVQHPRRLEPVVLNTVTYAPFNSQATLWNIELLPCMFLPTTCTMRCTDIYRAWCALKYMKNNELGSVCFDSRSVVQMRNTHDHKCDLRDEYHIMRWTGEKTISGLVAVGALSSDDLQLYETWREIYE